jgi:hypothetical protein
MQTYQNQTSIIRKLSGKTAVQSSQHRVNLSAAALADQARRHYACSKRECKGSCRELPPARGRLSSFVKLVDIY